jgi:hypothetical protein
MHLCVCVCVCVRGKGRRDCKESLRLYQAGAHPEFVLWGRGGADPEAICSLCLILKIIL